MIKQLIQREFLMENNIKAPTLCHCCQDGVYGHFLKLIEANKEHIWYINEKSHLIGPNHGDLRDIYMCINPVCKHVYRNYYGDSAIYHESDFREDQYDDTKNVLEMGSLEEQAERAQKVMNQLHLMKYFATKDDTVLEIASGKGYFLKSAKNYFTNLKGSDIDPKVINHNETHNPEIEVILSDVLKLPENKKHDVVVAIDVLEHVEDIEEFARKMYSLTNKYAIIQVPVERGLKCPNDPVLQGGREFDGHLHYFSEFSLNNLFTKNNMFKCVYMYKSFMGELANGREIFAIFEKNNKGE